MTSKRQLIRQQRDWAESAGLIVDERAYLRSVGANLRAPLSPSARAAFERGSGSELRSRGSRPAKLQALHSSAALAINAFDFWSERSAEAGPLLTALEIPSSLAKLRFEAQFETGLPGNPPNLDVALELESNAVVGIECKFTEWLTPKGAKAAPFKDKYFDGGIERWTEQGLPQCQLLASEMRDGKTAFRVLDAAQLLKHALGLTTQLGERGSLMYLFFDIDGPGSDAHRNELALFAERVDPALAFRAMSYQTLIGRLAADPQVDRAYTDYLLVRYCADK